MNKYTMDFEKGTGILGVTMRIEGREVGSYLGMQKSLWNQKTLNYNPCSTNGPGQIRSEF